MLAMAAGAGGSVLGTLPHSLAMDTLKVDVFDLAVAGTTGRGHVRPVHLGLGILGWQDVMASVAIRTGGRLGVPLGHLTAMHAQAIGLHWLGEGNLMFGEKLGIGMARSACIRQILLVCPGGGAGAGQNLMLGPMAGPAGRRVKYAVLPGHAMDTLRVGLDLVLVAGGAIHRRRLARVGEPRDAAVTACAAHACMRGCLEGHEVHLM